MEKNYIPKAGDIVFAHSCGTVENNGGSYTDEWYKGKILKVLRTVNHTCKYTLLYHDFPCRSSKEVPDSAPIIIAI